MSNVLLHKGQRLSEWQRCIDTYSFIKNTSEREVRAYILDEIYYSLQRFMIRSDRFGMAESVEIRTPFLHPNILKLTVNTPPKFLFGPIKLSFILTAIYLWATRGSFICGKRNIYRHVLIM